jgi:hypothetical protein
LLNVSDEFKAAIKANPRRVVGKVRISYSDPFLDPSVETQVNERGYISWPDQVVTISIDQETEDSAMTHKYACLDGSWVLDGTYYLAPDTTALAKLNHMGWWGKTLAGENRAFSEPYPTLTALFSKRTVIVLAVAGDDKRGEYPVDFDIFAYDESDNIVHTETVNSNVDVTWQKEIDPVNDVIKLVLQVRRWSHPGRTVKISGFFSVLIETYTGDDLFNINLLEEREFSDGTLPIGNISANEITVRISNIDHRFDAGNTASQLYNLVKANRKIKAWLGTELADGSIEFAPLGTFYANAWNVPEDDVYAEVTGRDRMEILTLDTFYTNVLQNVSLYDLINSILDDAGIVNRFVDEELKEYIVPYAYFNDDTTKRECLRIIAEASLSQAYMDRNGQIRIEGPSYLQTNSAVSIVTITRDEYFPGKNNPANYDDLANYIEVKTQPLAPVAVAEEVYNTDDDDLEPIIVGETKTVTVYYSKKPVIEAAASITDSPAGLVISTVKYYAWGADITVMGATIDGTFKIIVTGKPLEVSGSQTITAKDDASIKEHGKKPYSFEDNILIQTTEMANKIAQKCLELSKDSRRDLEMDWRGDPSHELGDRITVPDSATTMADFYIVSQELDYDGGLTCKLKGKKVAG